MPTLDVCHVLELASFNSTSAFLAKEKENLLVIYFLLFPKPGIVVSRLPGKEKKENCSACNAVSPRGDSFLRTCRKNAWLYSKGQDNFSVVMIELIM